jgi:hypothetical protein
MKADNIVSHQRFWCPRLVNLYDLKNLKYRTLVTFEPSKDMVSE